MMEYQRHPESEIYPRDKVAKAGLVYDMKRNGFNPAFPILTHDDKIIDGWHRYG